MSLHNLGIGGEHMIDLICFNKHVSIYSIWNEIMYTAMYTHTARILVQCSGNTAICVYTIYDTMTFQTIINYQVRYTSDDVALERL